MLMDNFFNRGDVQTTIYSNISHIISQIIRYIENDTKIWEDMILISIMSDNSDREICNEFGWIDDKLRTQLDKTNLAPFTSNASLSSVCV